MSRLAAAIAIAAMTTSAVLGCIGCNGAPAAQNEPATTGVSSAGLSVPDITWPAASSIDAKALASLGDEREAQVRVGRSVVPVLAPTGLSFERTPVLVVDGEYYAISARAEGLGIHVQGKRSARRVENVPAIAGNRALRGTKGFVSVNEGIRTASWIENGAAYSVDVECSSREDERCTKDDFVIGLVAKLAFVGGKGR